MKTKKNGIINVAYHPGQVFKKFKEKKKFTELVAELGIHKNIFRIQKFTKIFLEFTFLNCVKNTPNY